MNKIKAFRSGENLTLKKMANCLGMNVGTYAKKESGKNSFTVNEVKRFKEVFRLNTDQVNEMFIQD